MFFTKSKKSPSSSVRSRPSSYPSSTRQVLEIDGFEASLSYHDALRALNAANEKAEAERQARKAALYASFKHGRQRARRVINRAVHLVKRS